jgi:outer membrane protein assembly factor BamB
LKWKFNAGKDITSTPSIFNGTIYFPSWNGYIFAVKEFDGSLVWKKNLTKLTGLKATGFVANANWTVARATPTIAYDEDLVIVGIYGPAVVVALNRSNGELIWQTRLDGNDAGVVTMSGTYYRGLVLFFVRHLMILFKILGIKMLVLTFLYRAYYVGSSSLEELKSEEECCTFRGSFSKLDIKSGAILWQTFMLPDNKGKRGEYAGGALWGSSPSIDSSRNHIYIATGNLYSAPLRIRQCQEKQNNLTIPTHLDECIEEENHSNSILALDLDNGEIKWFQQFGGYDVWLLACNNLSVANLDLTLMLILEKHQ